MSAHVVDITDRLAAIAEKQRREDLARRVTSAILSGHIETAKFLVDREITATENARCLAARLRDESEKRAGSEAWNLAARVASGLAFALHHTESEASLVAMRRAVAAFAPLGARNNRLDALAHVDRKERCERLLVVIRGTVLVMARAANFADAAYVTYSATKQHLFPSAPDERASVLPELEAWLGRYMRRESSLDPDRTNETAKGIARRALQAFGLSPARAKDFFKPG